MRLLLPRPRARGPIRVLGGSLLLALVLAGGCRMLAVPTEPPRPTPDAPLWDGGEVEAHLRYFNRPESAGRATGTQGYAQSVAYVAARLREFGLQPILGDEFRTFYYTSLSFPVEATARLLGPDSLQLLPGIDFLPDGRTDADSLLVQDLVVLPPNGSEAIAPGSLEGQTVLLSAPAGAPLDLLRQIQAAGARVALLVGPLAPRLVAEPLEGLVILRLRPSAAAEVLGSAEAVAEWAGRTEPFRRRLSRPMQLKVRIAYDPVAGALNTMGFVPGAHPVLNQDLVVVCADLDAIGQFLGVRTLDFEHFGLGAAAVLELARHYGLFARYSSVPERTILFAVWSGARLDHAGLRAFLQNPPWALDAITDVIYVGLSPEEEPAVRKLLEARGLPLTAVAAPSEPLHERRSLLLPGLDPARRNVRRATEAAARRTGESPDLDLDALYDRAVVQVQELAAEAHLRLLDATVTPAPFRPLTPDLIPSAEPVQ